MTKKRVSYHHGNLREGLLRAAERALEQGGPQNLSLRELSRELGVSNTAPRRHFADKQALLDALALEGFVRLGVLLNRAAADRQVAFDVRLAKLGRAYVRFATKHAALIALMFAAKHHPDAPPELLEASNRALAIGPKIIAEGQAAGAVVGGDPLRLALVAFAALEGLVAIATDGMFQGVPLERIASEVVERVILGLRPRV